MAKTVKVYSTPTCPYCTMVKRYLDEKNITYTHYDVSADQEKAREMVDISGQMGVPVISIDGKVIVGFDKPKINAELGLE